MPSTNGTHPTITATNAQILIARMGLRGSSSKNGLISLKLYRAKYRLDREFEPIAKAWGDIDKAYAKLDEKGEPVIITSENGEPAQWTNTETPAYQPNPLTLSERAAKLKELGDATVSFKAERFTIEDLALIETASEHAGLALSLFTESDPEPADERP